ncbi:hypothetical protein LCGC14_3165420, partial [marine sediment metagenome]
RWRDYVLNGYKDLSDRYIKDAVKNSTGRITCRYRSRVLVEMGMRKIAESCPLCEKNLI